ncbi:MAG: DUF885 family protein [Pirellulaceae bacterium]|nr:DUF885 family protein [Pirellulaceae bacterium]
METTIIPKFVRAATFRFAFLAIFGAATIFWSSELVVASSVQDVADQRQDNQQEAQDEGTDTSKQSLTLGERLERLSPSINRLRPVAYRYRADQEILDRYYLVELSPTRFARMRLFHDAWLKESETLNVAELTEEELADLQRLRDRIERNIDSIESQEKRWQQVSPWLPFATSIISLAESRQTVVSIDPVKTAAHVQQIADIANQARTNLADINLSECGSKDDADAIQAAGIECANLKKVLQGWFDFYNSYDPGFTWWVKRPFEDATKALADYEGELKASVKTLENAEQEAAGETPSAENKTERSNILSKPFDFEVPPVLVWPSSREPKFDDQPNLTELMTLVPNRMAPIISEFEKEFGGTRRGGRGGSDAGRNDDQTERREKIKNWLTALEQLPYDDYLVGDQVDYHLLRHHLLNRLKRLEMPNLPGQEVTGQSGIRGRPIGREALMLELEREMIPYEPEELIEIAVRELAWCRSELVKAAQEMGYGENWRDAVEEVKRMYVAPGEQPWLVRQLSDETVAYLREHDLVSIFPLANETWRMRMMPLEQQLITPFFTGGEVVSVGFPTNAMTHEAKLQSLRGNNIPFSRATVHHELIPGHGLQQFMTTRYGTHRGAFGSPFWTEGWALYWEMLLYEHGYVVAPSDRVGFMVWRSHRCARIVFSLSFHLGLMNPDECVDYLVENVGFERLGAEGEVRRSFGGMYPPLYQAAYMVGGLQFRALEREFVKSGKMSHREFHDFILRQGRIPVPMIRRLLLDQTFPRDELEPWRFYDQ